MWSLLAKVLELLIRRSRLRVDARWDRTSGAEPYDLGKTALVLDLINPTGHDIPVDRVAIRTDTSTEHVTELLEGPGGALPTTVPARGRVRYALSLVDLVDLFLENGCRGNVSFRVVARHSTGRTNRSPEKAIDLEPLRTWMWVVRRVLRYAPETVSASSRPDSTYTSNSASAGTRPCGRTWDYRPSAPSEESRASHAWHVSKSQDGPEEASSGPAEPSSPPQGRPRMTGRVLGKALPSS